MTTAGITSKGRITLPLNVRQSLKLEAGDLIGFVEVDPGRFEIIAVTQSVKALKGMFGEAPRACSIDDMNQAIAARAASAGRAGRRRPDLRPSRIRRSMPAKFTALIALLAPFFSLAVGCSLAGVCL